ncbi:MAG: tol-pal system YbgF family protein, partial [Bacteroidia bacterium]
TPQEFALSQLEAYPLLTSRGENTPLAEQKEKAFSFYQNGQYSEALAVFESMFSSPDAGQTSDDIRMYYADCLSLTGKYPEAADQYQRLRDSDYYDAAEWRLVMVLILNNESAEARYILESITKNSLHYKHAEAVALLKKME